MTTLMVTNDEEDHHPIEHRTIKIWPADTDDETIKKRVCPEPWGEGRTVTV